MGGVLTSLGRYQEAIEHYQRALELNPNDPDYYYLIGGALIETGQIGQALGYLHQARKAEARLPGGLLQFGNGLCQNAHQSSQAIAAAQKALALARSKGQTALAKQTEDWLNSYRAGLPDLKNAPPSSK